MMFVDGLHVQVLVFHQPCSNGSRRWIWFAFDPCAIDSVHVSIVKLLLQVPLCCRILRKNHDARSVLVKAMNNVTPGVLLSVFEVVHASAVEGIGFETIGRYGEQTMGFVDDQEGIVFVQNIEVNRGCTCRRRRTLFSALTLQNLDLVPFLDDVFRSMHNFAVHHHPGLGEHLSKGGPAR